MRENKMDELFRRLFEELPCWVTAQDRDFKIIAANRNFQRDFGTGPRAYCYEVYKGRTSKCPVCPVEKTFADGKVHRSEELVRTKDGSDVQVIVFSAPVRNGSGEIVAAVEVSTDITEIKQLQQKYRALFEEVPCYISVQDRNLRLVEANRRFALDFGDHLGQPCYEVYKHRSEPCIPCSVAKTFQDGQTHESEEVVTSRDGQQINVLVSTAPIRDATGEIQSVMEMSTNITELRKVQSRLTSLGLLVGSISHGIKGLLTGLDGGIYLMESGFKRDKMDRVKQGWEIMQRNVDRIRSMVLNVLYYAKDREVCWTPIEIEGLCSSVETVLAGRAKQLEVDLKVEGASGTFEGDHSAVHAMLVNLLENSIDACRVDKKQVKNEVTLSVAHEGEQVVFEIRDNGIGMDRETREKAFSLFFSSKGAEGTGLGLFIAHKIVKNHGGTIEIESSQGVGTRFTVRLPRHRPADLVEEEPYGEIALEG
jgi:PAS domain S-box-containing protein